jgi:hypothetical protein
MHICRLEMAIRNNTGDIGSGPSKLALSMTLSVGRKIWMTRSRDVAEAEDADSAVAAGRCVPACSA